MRRHAFKSSEWEDNEKTCQLASLRANRFSTELLHLDSFVQLFHFHMLILGVWTQKKRQRWKFGPIRFSWGSLTWLKLIQGTRIAESQSLSDQAPTPISLPYSPRVLVFSLETQEKRRSWQRGPTRLSSMPKNWTPGGGRESLTWLKLIQVTWMWRLLRANRFLIKLPHPFHFHTHLGF